MLEERLIKELEDIEIVKEPFKKIADKLGTSQKEVLKKIEELKERGIIRQISPVYDARACGYDSALVAFKVEKDIENVAKVINSYPGVSHNYERFHKYNLWFTIAVPPDSSLSLEEIVNLLADMSGVKDYRILRAEKTFKIGVKLSFKSMFEREERVEVIEEIKPQELSEIEKKVIEKTQEDIELSERPFIRISENLGISEGDLIRILKELRGKRVLRRFCAVLRHRRAGFKYNVLTVWKVKDYEKTGNFLASFKCVSHCYLRSGWDYKLFAMIHGREEREVKEFINFLKRKIEPQDMLELISGREFMKRRTKLFTRDYYEWEEKNAVRV